MMSFVIGFLTVVLVLDCVFLILLVLIQLPKKEAGAGLAFGGGATDALFGAGSGTALTKITKYAAGVFLGLSLLLSDMRTQHAVQSGRSFEELSPHHFSFNSPLGWCPLCQGLGVQHGADPAALVPDGKRSLRSGAVAVWPALAENPAFARMIETMTTALAIDLAAPK